MSATCSAGVSAYTRSWLNSFLLVCLNRDGFHHQFIISSTARPSTVPLSKVQTRMQKNWPSALVSTGLFEDAANRASTGNERAKPRFSVC